MELFYKNRDMIRCLEVSYEREEQIDIATHEYQIKMLEANEIPYLLNVCVIHINNESTLRYLTKNCYVFSKRFEHQHMDGRLFTKIIGQIGKCADVLSLYLLSPENLVLNPDYMFYDEEEQCVGLVYVPGYQMNFQVQLKHLLEFMMRVFNSSDRDGIQQLYKMYSEIEEDTWGSGTFEKILSIDELSSEGYGKTISKGQYSVKRLIDEGAPVYASNNVIRDVKRDLSSDSIGDEGVSNDKFRDKIHKLNFLQRGILGLNISLIIFSLFVYEFSDKNVFWLYFAAAFCVLFAVFCAYAFAEEQEDEDEAMENFAHSVNGTFADDVSSFYKHPVDDEQIHALVPLTNGSLNEIVFSDYGEKIIVGRGKNEADYRLPTTEINRVHAYIYQKKGEIFLEDMASQNGTFLNSVRIPSNEIKKLNRGDIVGFANEEFFVS